MLIIARLLSGHACETPGHMRVTEKHDRTTSNPNAESYHVCLAAESLKSTAATPMSQRIHSGTTRGRKVGNTKHTCGHLCTRASGCRTALLHSAVTMMPIIWSHYDDLPATRKHDDYACTRYGCRRSVGICIRFTLPSPAAEARTHTFIPVVVDAAVAAAVAPAHTAATTAVVGTALEFAVRSNHTWPTPLALHNY